MKTKTMAALALALLFALTAFTAAFAEEIEDNSTIDQNSTIDLDDETKEEIGAMKSPYGAEMRLLQLERSVTLNILKGEEVVNHMVSQNSSADVSGLNSVLDEMQLLLEEIKAAPTTGNPEELAQEFVDLKDDAIRLSKEFRDLAREILPTSEAESIRARIANVNRNEIEAITDAIHDARNQHNADSLQALLDALGVENDELVDKVRTGEATQTEIKDALRAAFEGLSPEAKKDAYQKMRESAVKRNVYQKAAINLVQADRLNRIGNRIMARSETLAEMANNASQSGLKTRARILDKLSERTEELGERLQERSEMIKESIKNRVQDRIENRIENNNDGAGNNPGNGQNGLRTGGNRPEEEVEENE